MSAKVKLKTRRQPSRTSKPRGRTAGSGQRRRAAKGSGGVIVGLLGWLALGGLVAAMILTATRQRDREDRVRHWKAEQIAALQQEVSTREKTIETDRLKLTASINAALRKQETLISSVKELESTVTELEPQVKRLEKNQQTLETTVAAAEDNAGLVGEGLDDLTARLRKTEALKQRLVEEYRTRFQTMKAAYEERLARDEPGLMRQWYSSHRHTVFAPAAGFAAAEKTYAARRSDNARRIYADVLERYPTSIYAELCQARIIQIDVRAKFAPLDPPVPFEPFVPPESGDGR